MTDSGPVETTEKQPKHKRLGGDSTPFIMLKLSSDAGTRWFLVLFIYFCQRKQLIDKVFYISIVVIPDIVKITLPHKQYPCC